MEVPSLHGVFVLGCFERRITFYSQQVRALNLVHALAEQQRLPTGSRVLIIGAGAAGLTASVAASLLGARVTLLEQADEVMPLLRGNHTRWLHPHIYEWPEPGSENPHAGLPLLDWSAGSAGDVVRHIEQQWEESSKKLGIKFHRGVTDLSRLEGSEHTFTWSRKDEAPPHNSLFDEGSFDLVLLAVGFGRERTLPDVETPSYWADDNLHQAACPLPCRYLISGTGDGGLVDLLRVRLRNFRHDKLVTEFLSEADLDHIKKQLREIERKVDRTSPLHLFRYYKTIEAPAVDEALKKRARQDTSAILNGQDPYPLSSRACVLNRFLVSRMLRLGLVDYKAGALKVERLPSGGFNATFGSGKPKSFDRVVIRHGALGAPGPEFSWLAPDALKQMRARSALDQTRHPLWPDGTFTPAAFNAPRTSTTPPSTDSRLIGRKNELDQVLDAVLAKKPLPVVVLGQPGIGKSAIARAAFAHAAVEHRYGNRRYFAHLDSAHTAESVFAGIAQAMGVISPSDLPTRVLAELAKAPTLLVLDDADILWLEDRPEMERLLEQLASSPALALLITIRGKERPVLGGLQRRTVWVPPLMPEESRELFHSIADDVDPDNSDIRYVLQKMEGMALAVKLLAIEAQAVDPKVTRQRWRNEGTKMLQSGSDRNSSLPISIEFSLKSPRLSEALNRLSLLALLPAGIAEQDLLSILPESAKAIALLQKAALVESDGSRLRLRVVIREYIHETRPPQEEDKKKLIGFYIPLASQLGPRVGKVRGGEALEQLSNEFDNIEKLLLMEFAEEKDTDAAINAVLHLSDFIRFSGRGSPRLLEKTCAAAKKRGDTEKQAECLLALGRLHLLRRPQYDMAGQYLEDALRLFQQAGNHQGEASCLRELGHTAANEYEQEQIGRKLQQAQDYFERALAMQQLTNPDPIGEAYCLHGLARVAGFQGDEEEARRLFQKTLQMFQEQEDLLGQAYSLRHLGELDEDDSLLRKACAFFSEVGELHNLAHGLRGRSDIARKRGRLEEAERLCREALELFQNLRAHREAAWCSISLAQVVHKPSRDEEARKLLEEALASAQEQDDTRCAAECRRLLGEWRI